MKSGASTVTGALARSLTLGLTLAALATLFAFPGGAGATAGLIALAGVLGWGVVFGATRLQRSAEPGALRAVAAMGVLGVGAAGVFLAPDTAFSFSAHRVLGRLVSPGGAVAHVGAFLVVIAVGVWVFASIAGRAEALSPGRRDR